MKRYGAAGNADPMFKVRHETICRFPGTLDSSPPSSQSCKSIADPSDVQGSLGTQRNILTANGLSKRATQVSRQPFKDINVSTIDGQIKFGELIKRAKGARWREAG